MRPVMPPSDARRITGVGGRARNLERRFARPRTLIKEFDGLGSELAVGDDWNPLSIHFDAIITSARLLAKEVGDLVIDIWKAPFGSFPPTVADTITAAAPPTLSAAQSAEDSTLPGWTTAVFAGDTFKFNVDSVSGITKATLMLRLAA